MAGPHRTRRAYLAGLALPLSGALAGCNSLTDLGDESTPTPASYDHLTETTTHVASGVDLALPDDVPTADTPADAELVVLAGGTDVAAEVAVGWLDEDGVVALLGDGAQATWQRWVHSDAYRDSFGDGAAVAEPEPDLVVAFAVGGEYVSTHRSTWGHTDDPADDAVLEALESALRDEATRTPRD